MMHESAAFLRDHGIGNVDVGIILGSGLAAMDAIIDVKVSIDYAEIPHLPHTGAPGHKGVLKYGKIGTCDVLMFCGRLHYYEGHPMWMVPYPVRVMQSLGVPRIVVTAAVGGLNTALAPGDLILITDHINLMPDNPLRGLVDPDLGERFPDMTNAYDPDLSLRLRSAAQSAGINLTSGVYASLQGPSLETQAECRFLQLMGADVVGMSVVPEVIAGVQAGILMAAICIVSNRALHPGDPTPSTVAEILSTADAAVPRLASLLKVFCSNI